MIFSEHLVYQKYMIEYSMNHQSHGQLTIGVVCSGQYTIGVDGSGQLTIGMVC